WKNGRRRRAGFRCGGSASRRKWPRQCGSWPPPKRPTLQARHSKLTVESSNNMEDATALKERIKAMMVENLMLQVTAAEIADDLPLFGPGGLGLDSVDALQLVVGLDKNFGVKIPDPAAAKEILQTVNTIADAVQKKVAAA